VALDQELADRLVVLHRSFRGVPRRTNGIEVPDGEGVISAQARSARTGVKVSAAASMRRRPCTSFAVTSAEPALI